MAVADAHDDGALPLASSTNTTSRAAPNGVPAKVALGGDSGMERVCSAGAEIGVGGGNGSNAGIDGGVGGNELSFCIGRS